MSISRRPLTRYGWIISAQRPVLFSRSYIHAYLNYFKFQKWTRGLLEWKRVVYYFPCYWAVIPHLVQVDPLNNIWFFLFLRRRVYF